MGGLFQIEASARQVRVHAMFARLRKELGSPAMIVALVALSVALGGTSYAALTITGKQVKNNSLTGADIKNGSIAAADLSAAARKSLAGAAGPAGPAGAAGTAGANGVNGTNGADGATGANGADGSALAFARVYGSTGNCAVDAAKNVSSTCTQTTTGQYSITVTGGVNLTGRTGLCGQVGNGGVPTAGVYWCDVQITSATTARVSLFYFDDSATDGSGANGRASGGALGMYVAFF